MGIGYLKKIKIGIFAYINPPVNITTTAADTWYPILNNWNNVIMEQFHIGAAGAVYDGPKKWLETKGNATFSSDTASTTLYAALRVKGVICTSSVHITRLAQVGIGEYKHLSLCCVKELDTNDNIEVVIKSDKAGAVVTVQSLTMSTNEFFKR